MFVSRIFKRLIHRLLIDTQTLLFIISNTKHVLTTSFASMPTSLIKRIYCAVISKLYYIYIYIYGYGYTSVAFLAPKQSSCLITYSTYMIISIKRWYSISGGNVQLWIGDVYRGGNHLTPIDYGAEYNIIFRTHPASRILHHTALLAMFPINATVERSMNSRPMWWFIQQS